MSSAGTREALRLLPAEELSRLETEFRRLLPLPLDTEPHLLGALRDTLDHPGSLARAQLAFGVASELGMASASARKLALAVEAFHTASLLFDDLPAMDDARERRGFPCPHVVHGEAAAMLAALGLITRAYERLWQVFSKLPPAISMRSGALVAECLGASGALQGQALDLHFRAPPGETGAREVERVALGKTVSLVRLSLVLPALVAGATEAEIVRLELLSRAWGLAYQGLDDAKDLLLETHEAGKSTARDTLLGRPNLAVALGWQPTLERLAGWLSAARAELGALRALRPGWSRLAGLQLHLEAELAAVIERLAPRAEAA